MAKLPPPRETYTEELPKQVFDGIEGKTVPDGRLALAEIAAALTGVDWKSTGLHPETMAEALTKAVRTHGDTLMNWNEFWNFCLKNGTGHPPDPAELVKEYLLNARVLPLFETLTAALLFHKPEKPRKFIVEALQALKAGSGEALFSDTDLKTMFGMFDITGRGTISVDQCNAALMMLLGEQKDCRATLGQGAQLLNCDQFIKVVKEALASVAPMGRK